MSELVDFQKDFLNCVFKPSDESIREFSEYLQPTHRMSCYHQYNVYAQSINICLINALINVYPVCEKITGEGFFYEMARNYCLTHPSKSPDLADYGSNYSRFIEQYSYADCLPYLGNVAKLEWAYHQLFNCADQGAFDFCEFTKYSAEQLTQCVFSLPVSSCLIKSNYPIDVIWQAHQVNMNTELEIDKSCRFIYLYRKDYAIHIDNISLNEYQFLQLISQHKKFIDVCSELNHVNNVTELLVKSLKCGWINKVTL